MKNNPFLKAFEGCGEAFLEKFPTRVPRIPTDKSKFEALFEQLYYYAKARGWKRALLLRRLTAFCAILQINSIITVILADINLN